MTSTHNYADVSTPIKYQGLTISPVEIADNVWIGAGVTVLSGRKIGYGSIVGANSLVTKDIPDFQIWGGVPAKLLKTR
jgi:acetyltransferase-like isoleucine patch superfamily enzyme